MSRPATTLRTRLRTRTISLPTNRLFTINTDSMKAQASQWEPSLHLDSLFPSKQQHGDNNNDDQDGEDDLTWMMTYSAFDPGSLRPLLLRSGFGVGIASIGNPNMHGVDNLRCRGSAVEDEEVIAKGVPATTTTTTVTRPCKSWRYRLPLFLQPQVGTTFEMMHRTTTASLESATLEKAPQRTSILQAVLYGIPEPEKFSYVNSVVRDGGFMHNVLYRVQDTGGNEDGTAGVCPAKVTEIDGDEANMANRAIGGKGVEDGKEEVVVELGEFEVIAK